MDKKKRHRWYTKQISTLYLPHCSAQLLIRHARVVFLATPHLRNSLRLNEAEDTSFFIFPAQKSWVEGGIF
jgi:hypothetical protein